MAENVRKKFFSGIAWTFIQNVVVRALGLIVTIILARLLLPEDYGLIGMLSIFIAISDVFIQSGFGQALIQKSDCSDEDFSTAFYFNVAVSVLIYVILFFSAPYIADFYHEPKLIIITRVLSLNFVFGSFNVVQQSKLKKSLNFKPLAIITLICTFISGVIGIGMAYCGYGVWALVGQTLSATFLRVVFFPIFTKWHPNKPFNIQSFRHLWAFGSKILVTGILDVVIVNLSNILIGRYYDKEQVGYFSKARNFADIPAMTMSTVLGTVLYPVLSEIHNNEERHTAVYRKVTRYSIILSFPVMIILAILAKPIVIILFTEKWAPAIPLLRALLLARCFLTLNVINANMLQSRGETRLYMHLYFLAGPVSLLAIIISIPYGVQAMAWATLISGYIHYAIFAIAIGKKIDYGYFRQLRDRGRIFIALIIMSISVLFSTVWLTSLWLQLIVGVIVGFVVYIVCCKLFNIVDEELVKMVRDKIQIRFRKN